MPHHMSAAKRMRMEREAIMTSVNGDGNGGNDNGDDQESGADRMSMAKSRKMLAAMGDSSGNPNSTGDGDGDGNGNDNDDNDNDDDGNNTEEEDPNAAAQSLLEQATKLKQSMTAAERAQASHKEEETRILKEASKVQTNALQAASELAQGVVYSKSLPTSWTCPRYILSQGEASWDKIRNNWHILVEGLDPPPPMKSFADMKLPKPILDYLDERNIKRPTPIQMQGLPVALAGRDMVGIAFTGSGKTMTFSLPLIMAALEEEVRMPLVGGEGRTSDQWGAYHSRTLARIGAADI
mmetsp:Transcript_16949/g.25498  ORF Transcript_16949/g.25498 Transcript_16949/m.25498 type:complete len:295 (+) Transcript_16949:446-1330(+)